MLFKELVVTFGIISLVNSQMTDLETMYLNFFVQLESVKKSVDILKLQLEMKNEKPTCSQLLYTIQNCIEQENEVRKLSKSFFDARFDALPKHCNSNDNPPPSNCAKATDCIPINGFYNITVSHYSDQSFLAFCDTKIDGGDWLYILRRRDGSENFNRPWSDYVKGFGNVASDYWIGLENLYALTNFDGPQELYVYMEDWEGGKRYAKYDEFAIGSASENYKLKTLGKYSGNAGDSLRENRGSSFSTYDSDSCAVERKGGWWHTKCSVNTNPTGIYYKGGVYTKVGSWSGMYWFAWKQQNYSYKTMNFMIRRKRI